MADHGPADLRNVAFVGASGAGKTTLVEALLHKSGAIPRMGSVADGSSNVDFDPLEREKKHSLYLKVLRCTHKKHHLNLLDTPGYPDHIGEALAALNVVETAAICVSAADGATFHTRRLWQETQKLGRGRVVVISRADVDGYDPAALLSSLGEVLGPECQPINLPIHAGPGISGVLDLITEHESAPDDMKDLVASAREQLVEGLVSLDDDIMEQYLESGEVSVDVLVKLLNGGVTSGVFTPVLFVSTEKNVGVAKLLDFIVKECPSPLEGPYFEACEGTEISEELHKINPVERTEFAGRVFKTVADPYVGRLSFVRVVSGGIGLDDLFTNPRIGKPEKMGHMTRPNGKEQDKVDLVCTGDIIALTKAETIETDDTICSEKAPVLFLPMAMPIPMVALAVTPKNRNEEQKLSLGLRKVVGEDPTCVLDRDSQTGELIIKGVSMLHIETLLKRLLLNYKVDVETKIPKVPMRETISSNADGHHRHKKQSGGRGQFGEVYLRVLPKERGAGFEFKDETYGGSIPKQYLPAIEKGIIDQMSKGVVAGYPVVDVEVQVYDGKYHDVDSDEASFKMAGSRAFRNAFEAAKPMLLEPVVNLEVAIPSRFMGDVNSDLNGRRGRISGMDAIGDMQVIKAQVPLKEVQTYGPDLRSISHGEGSFTFEVSHYDTVPHKVAEDLMAAHKAGLKPDED